MNLEINEKNIEIVAGLKFIKKLDENYTIDQSGMKFGLGIQNAYVGLTTRNPLTLVELILCGQLKSKEKATVNEIEDYIESLDDLEPLFDDFLELLSTSSITKKQVEVTAEQFKKGLEQANQFQPMK